MNKERMRNMITDKINYDIFVLPFSTNSMRKKGFLFHIFFV